MAVRFLGGRWCVEFQLAGERVFRRLPRTEDKAAAKALESKLRHEIFQRRTLGKPEEPLLAAVIEAWLRATQAGRKDKRNPRQNATHLAAFVKGKTLRQVADAAREAVTAWTVRDAKPSVSAKPLSAATINRRLDVLRASARWAWTQGIATENFGVRVPRLREENARQVYLTSAQVRALAKAGPTPTCTAAIMLAAYTGLRAGELLSLNATPTRSASLLVGKTKSGKPRTIPISGPARPYLSALPLDLSYRQLVGQFWLARKKAGMPHVRWHDLRHTTASLLINAGVDLYTVGKILGHATPATTARYAHLSDASVKAAMRKLR